jgi:4-cresol dehydrogenase (hydroxylating) flavoprotein subunit
MDQIADMHCFNGTAQIHLSEAIKNVLDPKGILAPGKSGTWLESYDNEAGGLGAGSSWVGCGTEFWGGA